MFEFLPPDLSAEPVEVLRRAGWGLSLVSGSDWLDLDNGRLALGIWTVAEGALGAVFYPTRGADLHHLYLD